MPRAEIGPGLPVAPRPPQYTRDASEEHSGSMRQPDETLRRIVTAAIVAVSTALAMTSVAAIAKEMGSNEWKPPHCATPIHPEGQDHC